MSRCSDTTKKGYRCKLTCLSGLVETCHIPVNIPVSHIILWSYQLCKNLEQISIYIEWFET